MALSNEKRGLTYAAVAEACELLVTNGYLPEKISLRDIRRETTGGSLSTVQKHRARWLSERRDTLIEPIHISESELDSLRSSVAELFAKKTADMRAEFEVSAALTRATVERLELDLEEALQSNDELQMQCQEAESHTEQLQRDVSAANLRADELVAANAQLREVQRRSLIDNGPVVQIPPELVQDASANPLPGSGQEAVK